MILLYFGILVVPGLLLSNLGRLIIWRRHGKPTSTASNKFPGPKQYQFIGRVHDLPKYSMWRKFKEWADTYGPIYQTSMMGQKFVIVSDEDIATDILVKKGNSFSGRPQIRALIDHKLGPTYEALQDRNGTPEPGPSLPWTWTMVVVC